MSWEQSLHSIVGVGCGYRPYFCRILFLFVVVPVFLCFALLMMMMMMRGVIAHIYSTPFCERIHSFFNGLKW